MLSPNTILQNRYRVIRELGHGGMGTVYEALDQRVNCIVALKETIAGNNEEARRAFEREASLLGNLRHSALPKVMDYFSEDDGDFLIMEFIPGYDLAELLELRGNPFPQAQTMRWADELLKVLEYLHGQNPPILHRDIKPSNLKLTKQGEIFLLDFGLAKGSLGQMPTLATSRSVRGYTPVYASLEQIHGHGTDARSDLYSLGATLYHLLTGIAPIDAPTRFHAVEDDQPDPLPPIQQLNPQASANVAEVIHQAMAVSRKQRPISAAEMRKALRNAAEEDERRRAAAAERAEVDTRRGRADLPPTVPVPPGPTVAAAGDATPPTERPSSQPAIKTIPAPNTAGNKRVLVIAAAVLGVAVVGAITLWSLRGTSTTDSSLSNSSSAMKTNQQAGSSTTNLSLSNKPPNPPSSLRSFEFLTATLDSSGNLKSRDRKSANAYTEDLGGGVKLEMVAIPPGEFMMGSPDNEAQRSKDEGPQHRVRINYWFYMGEFEVTQAQWRSIMGANPSNFKNCDACPVEQVSWDDAAEFCRRLSARSGHEYRLPSEAEWEYAARAGTTTPFAFGDTITPEIVNYNGEYPYGNAAKGRNRQKTVAVGSLSVANAFGLFDMHGNVWEWCQDWYHDSYHDSSSAIAADAPTDGSAWATGGEQKYRLLRGGSWFNYASGMRSAVRSWDTPVFRNYGAVGFRVVAVARTQ